VRYDAGWQRFRDAQGVHPGSRRGVEGGWSGFGPVHPQDRRDWGPPPGHDEDLPGARGLQGPARYGLGPYHERLRRRRRPDEEIQRDVEDAIFYDTWVDADAISVEVDEGVVTLRGELPSYDEVRFATDDAWDIDGVVGVRTKLRVPERDRRG
jgi:hypothetical protein